MAGLAVALAAAVAGAEGPACPRIDRLVWQAPQRIVWRMEETPLWFSVGHLARVLAWVPLGVDEQDGRPVLTEDGRGSIYAIRLEWHDVETFDPVTGLPSQTRMTTNVTIRADDAKARERRKGWGFPSEQGKDFEFNRLPALGHQALFRLYRHGESPFWQTLMVHAEADTEPMPPARAAAAGSTQAFTTFQTYTIVCELVLDPDLPMTSTYIEPDDPPSTNWLSREPVPAPWSAGKARLEPVRGSLAPAGGGPRFAPFSEAARRAAESLAQELRAQGLPNHALQWDRTPSERDLPEFEPDGGPGGL